MKFNYISQLKVNNCYTHKDFKIPNKSLDTFKHIILTGKNGSGKTTILSRIHHVLSEIIQKGTLQQDAINKLKRTIHANPNHRNIKSLNERLEKIQDVEINFLSPFTSFPPPPKDDIEKTVIYFYKANRKVELLNVETVTREDNFISQLKNGTPNENFTKRLKQYLVNKKVYEAFNYMGSETEKIKQSQKFFEKLTSALGYIFEDSSLRLEFVQEEFEFYIILKDSRRITFNQLSDGFSAFFNIIMDLMIRIDLIRKIEGDYSLNPKGIVLIDEPETHLHLSLQYNILPIISSLFPNIQLIIATHSPAIISSAENAIVYDLTTKEEVSDWILGSSFSELMISHFGLDNEYSPIADEIIEKVNDAVKNKDYDALNEILENNNKYLTPALRLEIESQIITARNKEKND
ncbi:AAA family ATPase [Flagellimonas marinaquae]|uniref:AAA family ATPase n=1 Tax=Flagellimonas marinaquae TaxID=254955 RepID=UPI002074C66E|nr:AAA family ATPase [Allomuricauda aquimarina]USD26603.1 ATP-binding protein [Allomuricauda aquimarina]